MALLKRHLPELLLILLLFLVYGVSLGNDFVTWDDGLLIFRNTVVQEFSVRTVVRAFTSFDPELYVPLTILSYQLEHLAVGLQPFLYHVDNLLLHIANSLLVFFFFTHFFRNRWLAFGLALLFAVHPVNAEAVAWISARKDVLSAFFFLLSLEMYVLYLRKGEVRIANDKTIISPFALRTSSFIFFLLALLSKVTVAVLPPILLLLDWYEQRRWSRGVLVEKVPFFGLSFVFGIIALLGKFGTLLSAWESLLLFSKSVFFSLGKFIVPIGLSVAYPQVEPVTISTVVIPLIALIAFILIMIASFRYAKNIFFGLAFFFLTMLPSAAAFTKGESIHFASDRFLYIPMVGLLFLMGAGLQYALRRWSATRWPLLSAFVIVTCIFATLAHARSLIWKNSETLYLDALSKYPESASIQYNLGLVYDARGEDERALPYYREAIRLRPRYADAYNNRGAIFLDQGQFDQAITELTKAIEIDPNHAKAHANLGFAYGRKGMYEKGLEFLQRALELDPSQSAVAERLKLLLERRGL